MGESIPGGDGAAGEARGPKPVFSSDPRGAGFVTYCLGAGRKGGRRARLGLWAWFHILPLTVSPGGPHVRLSLSFKFLTSRVEIETPASSNYF